MAPIQKVLVCVFVGACVFTGLLLFLLHNHRCLRAAAKFDSQLDSEWELWKKTYNKTYPNKVEEGSRRELWEQNLKLITKHNLEASMGLHTYELGMNHMGDLRPEEMWCFTPFIPSTDIQRAPSPLAKTSRTAVPDTINWSKEGYVTKVRNQGDCGSCWAFSAVGALEGQLFKKTGKLVELSPQNLLDCSSEYGNHGCKRGYIEKAFQYVRKYGINSEYSYPYTGQVSQCHYNPHKRAANCSEYKCPNSGDEEALKQALATIGPISVLLDASLESFRFYNGGLYNDTNCTHKVNHAMLAVGYGTLNGQDYWLLKNSWGSIWGERGYMLLARNKSNHCAIALQYCYPIM